MFGKIFAEPSLKLNLLRLQMQPLYQDVKICDDYIIPHISLFSILLNDLYYCIDSGCRRVAI
jgi:hypothetical protein